MTEAEAALGIITARLRAIADNVRTARECVAAGKSEEADIALGDVQNVVAFLLDWIGRKGGGK